MISTQTGTNISKHQRCLGQLRLPSKAASMPAAKLGYSPCGWIVSDSGHRDCRPSVKVDCGLRVLTCRTCERRDADSATLAALKVAGPGGLPLAPEDAARAKDRNCL